MKDANIIQRKADHLRINLDQDVQSGLTTGLEHYHFVHQALPEIDLDEIDTSCTFLGKQLKQPFLISSMTGGTAEADVINQRLASAAQQTGIAIGVGSQRPAIDDPKLESGFQIRKYAPNAVVLANLGAIQLNNGYTVEHCRKAVDMIEADGLILHLNPLQEALQPEGNTNWKGLITNISSVIRKVGVPVIIKEVGWGINGHLTRKLIDMGVYAIDVAGAGGTSWSQVEMYRYEDENQRRIAQDFRDWGIPTADAIRMAVGNAPEAFIIASGGIKNGIDAAKCLALGAHLSGMAGTLLKAAAKSESSTLDAINAFSRELRICMFGAGVENLDQLREKPVLVKGLA